VRLTNHPAVQILWDIHHPFRIAGESIVQSMHNLNGYVKYTHIKDSLLNEDGENYTYVPLGSGEIPLFEAIHALKQRGYDGWLTLEWEKRWCPQIDPPEVIFPQYIAQMGKWLAEM
jgi:sugar phosphate isomerase/epimerase